MLTKQAIIEIAEGIRSLAMKIIENADAIDEHAFAVDVYEGAKHLSEGAQDPVCGECGFTQPPDEFFAYHSDDGCPGCGDDEYGLFTWASSLPDKVSELMSVTVDMPKDHPTRVLAEEIEKKFNALGPIDDAIRVMRS